MHIPPRRYVAYARKSTDRDDKQMLSIPAQLRELRELAARRGITIAEERIEHHSAREPGRPVFSQLLKDVESGKVDGLLCWKPDRLARNPVDGGRITHALGRTLREIVTSDRTYDATSDKLMLSFLFGAATMETDNLVKNVKRGNRDVHSSGRITGRPPLGYVKHRETRFYRGAGRCVPDPERYESVRQIWLDMLTGTMTVADAWRRAVERGLQGRSSKWGPGGLVAIETVHGILRNRFYAGSFIRCGETYEGEHPPMVTPDQFRRVQALLSKRGQPRKRVHDFLYRGMLHCGECDGSLLIGESARGRSAYYTYYRCHKKQNGRIVCQAPPPSEDQVTADIQAYLDRVTLPEPLYRWSLEAVEWWLSRGRVQAADIAQEAKRQLAVAETRLKNLTDHLLDGDLDRDEYAGRKLELQDEIGLLRRRVASPTDALDEWAKTTREMIEVGHEYAEQFRVASDEERRLLLGHVVSNHIVVDRKVMPILRFPYSLLAEVPPSLRSEKPPVSNRLPPPAKVLEHETTARSGSATTRGLVSWWTKLLAIRTQSTGAEAVEGPKTVGSRPTPRRVRTARCSPTF